MAKRPNDSDGPGTAEMGVYTDTDLTEAEAIEDATGKVFGSYHELACGLKVTCEVCLYRRSKWDALPAKFRDRFNVSTIGPFVLARRVFD